MRARFNKTVEVEVKVSVGKEFQCVEVLGKNEFKNYNV